MNTRNKKTKEEKSDTPTTKPRERSRDIQKQSDEGNNINTSKKTKKTKTTTEPKSNNIPNTENTKNIIEKDIERTPSTDLHVKEKKKHAQETNTLKQENTIEPNINNNGVNINNFWQAYYDNTYKRNFYFNPFTNESVWDLPEGANVTNTQVYDPNQYQTLQNPEADQKEPEKEEALDEDDYYDEEAWEEDDLVEKLIWDKLKQEQLEEWMKRPARQQVPDTRRDIAYIEGNYDYNIWYDKYLTDRKEEREKIPALNRCNPALDIGYTKADLQEKEGAYFCLYFAKGCCSEGVNCKYYHRVPTLEDCKKIENLRDVFGRARFATPRNDMGGVGTFTKECRTLHVTGIKMIDSANPMKEMMRILYDGFSPFGEIEDINYISTKGIAFIRFSHRCSAEFAKEAMVDQYLIGEEILTIKWAYEDPNPMNKNRLQKEDENRFLHAYSKKKINMEKIKEKHKGEALPNTDYCGYYNQINNPYADREQEITNNCIKLAETLQMIENNNRNL
jgi:hypothetical protein